MDKENLRRMLVVAFAISGFTALVYEIVWMRPLQLIFGSTIYAVSTMLSGFLFGFALGAYLFRNLADKAENPVKVFALLELGIGVYGFIILGLFKVIPKLYIGLNAVFLQFLLAFVVVLIPATLFGGTWPVMSKSYSRLSHVGKDMGVLYGWNSFGAVLGSLGAGFLLIPLLGITRSAIIAACLNLLIGVIFIKKRRDDGS